jgi:hypothetical protein
MVILLGRYTSTLSFKPYGSRSRGKLIVLKILICLGLLIRAKFLNTFQMSLGSAFGAFLDPVADKVWSFVFN